MTGVPKKIKVYDKRFGNIAIEKGFLALDALIKALEIQAQEEIERRNIRS